MFYSFKSREDLADENKRLKEEIITLKDGISLTDIDYKNQDVNHRTEIGRLLANHSLAIEEKENQIIKLTNNFKTNLEREVASEKKNLRIQSEKQDREHTDRMKKLEAEYAAKIAKCDRDLESDKASYRKYLREEKNTTFANLEKENKTLLEEVSGLRSVNTALEGINGVLEGQVKSTTELMKGLVSALPSINAEFTTPEIPSSNVTVGSGNKS